MNFKRLKLKVVRIEDIVNTWLKLSKYAARITDYDKDTEIYTSNALECDNCGKTEYHKNDLLYLELLKNKGYCINCILKRGLKKNDIKRDRERFKRRRKD